MSTTSIIEPDLSELTARQRRAWAAGDYSKVASRTKHGVQATARRRRPPRPVVRPGTRFTGQRTLLACST